MLSHVKDMFQLESFSRHKYIYINRLRWQQSFVFICFYLSSTFPNVLARMQALFFIVTYWGATSDATAFIAVDSTLYNMAAFSFEEWAFAHDDEAKSLHLTYSVALRFVFLLIFQ